VQDKEANNPAFECAEAVLMLPFGRRSYLPAIAVPTSCADSQ
jgi:hypothetical protein